MQYQKTTPSDTGYVLGDEPANNFGNHHLGFDSDDLNEVEEEPAAS